MKTKTIKTRKFASGLKANQVYYTFIKGSIREIRISKAECHSGCSTTGWPEYEYEVAGLGSFNSGKIVDRIYKTVEDAKNGVNAINLNHSTMYFVTQYLKEKKIISLRYVSYGAMNFDYYIKTWSWDGVKPVLGGDICVYLNILNGEIRLEYEDDVYLTPEECREDNEVQVVRFVD